MNLEALQKRLKGSHIYKGERSGVERLYFRFGKQTAKMRTDCWFEIVNDRITPFVRIKCDNQPRQWCESQERTVLENIHAQFHEIINNCELERRKVPLHERLRDDIIPVHENSLLHQAQALRFCCSMKVTALFADTGTGKTKVAFDLAVSRYEAGQIKKVQIFCPVSTKHNFMQEVKKWCPNSAVEWKVTGLETMSSSDTAYIEALAYVDNETMIIVDESHACKTPFAKRSKRIHACSERCSYKLIMTGTPAESVKDMYMQYAMLSDLIIGERNWLDFEAKYLIVDERGDVIGYKNVNHLMGLVEPYTYQIRKEDCMDLPDKHFYTLEAGLTYEQQKWYGHYKEELLERIAEYYDSNSMPPVHLIFLYFTKLQQVACGFRKDEAGTIQDLGNCKWNRISDTGYEDGQTIFFSKYLFEVEKLISYLGRENCSVFTGKNLNERDAEKELFTNGQRKYFVATMGSGGTGLNGLQHCNRIVFWSSSFKWTERKQCIGRIDRQGQMRKMHIYTMRSKCGIEYRILENLSRKGNLADEIKQLLHDKTKLKNYVRDL